MNYTKKKEEEEEEGREDRKSSSRTGEKGRLTMEGKGRRGKEWVRGEG